MAAPSLTYTLTNGTTADASQVMQNFNDLLNGITDGSKDLSISALTCAGTATLNGHVNLGNSSSDDLTVTASLASNLVPKTDATYALGSSSRGYSGLYLSNGSSLTARIIAAAHAAARDYTIPDCSANASFVMTQIAQTISGTKTFDGQLIGKGTATNDSASAGYIGEYISNNRSSDTPALTSATYFSIDSGNATFNDGNEVGIVLTAGDWDVVGSCQFTSSGAVTITNAILFIGTAKGNDSTGANSSLNWNELNALGWASGADFGMQTPIWRVSISSQTTYYLKGRVTHSGGTNVTARGVIRARRVR